MTNWINVQREGERERVIEREKERDRVHATQLKREAASLSSRFNALLLFCTEFRLTY